MQQVFEGVYKQGKEYYTKNAVPGKKVYGEEIITVNGVGYRHWNAFRSKPAAAFKKGLKNWPLKKNSKVLYLGIAEGTTASHFSDILTRGVIIGVEVSSKPFEKLLLLCEERKNIIPVLADANKPEEYEDIMREAGKVDVVYGDVAQPHQTDVLLKNCEEFLKDDGFFVLMLKTKSIDVTKPVKEIIGREEEKIRKAGFEVVETVLLDPFEKAHACIIGRKSA